MTNKLNRREFIVAGTAAITGAAASGALKAQTPALVFATLYQFTYL